jgi:hypothetical protein
MANICLLASIMTMQLSSVSLFSSYPPRSAEGLVTSEDF